MSHAADRRPDHDALATTTAWSCRRGWRRCTSSSCPLGKNDAERAPSIAAAEKLAAELRGLPRDEFFGYEPIAREGRHDVRQAAGLPVRRVGGARRAGARRDRAEGHREERVRRRPAATCPARRASSSASRSPAPPSTSTTLLRDIQKALFDRAKAFRDARIVTANTLRRVQGLFPIEGRDEAALERSSSCAPTGTARARRRTGCRRRQGDDPLHAVRRPEGAGHVHRHGQAVGAPRGVRAGVLSE